jgi:hypothetical protein
VENLGFSLRLQRRKTAIDATNNISLPESLRAEIQSAAQAEHRSADEVLTDALKRNVCRETVRRRTFMDEAAGVWRGAGDGAGHQKESDIDRLIAESRAEQRSHWGQQNVISAETIRVLRDLFKEDPDDDRMLECAATTKSDFIISEDGYDRVSSALLGSCQSGISWSWRSRRGQGA